MEDLNAVRSAVDAWMTKKRSGPKPNQDMPDIVDLLLATGCRIGEVLALRWTDIDLTATPPTVVDQRDDQDRDRKGHLPEAQAEVRRFANARSRCRRSLSTC